MMDEFTHEKSLPDCSTEYPNLERFNIPTIHGVHFDFAVCTTPQSMTLWCHTHYTLHTAQFLKMSHISVKSKPN